MSMFYGNKFLDLSALDLQPELEIYVSSDMVLPLSEDPIMKTITVSSGKLKVKINIANQEGCSTASSTSEKSSKAPHGPRAKYIDADHRQGIPIQIRINTDEVFFGADSSCKNRTPDEAATFRSKDAKFAFEFVEDNREKFIQLWKETDYQKAIDIINSMNSKKYKVKVK